MRPSGTSDPAPPRIWGRLTTALAAAIFGLHLAVNAFGPYGFHRDEFLYLAMGRHLSLWRMDFPPGIAILSEAVRALFGDGLTAIRLLPAAGHAILILAGARLAGRLGAGPRAAFAAAVAIAGSPLFLRSGQLFQPVVFDQLAWTLALATLIPVAEHPLDGGPWIRLGTALGLGLLVKFSIAFIGLGIVTAVLLSPRLRPALATPWPYAGAVTALLVGSPSLIGQLRLGFPVVLQLAGLRAAQLEQSGRLGFLTDQPLFGPIVLLAAAGLVGWLRRPRHPAERPIAIATLAAFVLLFALSGKGYYWGPAYVVLAAAGATVLDRSSRPAGLAWASIVVASLAGMALLPMALPVVPPPALAEWLGRVGLTAAVRTNAGQVGELPQDFADMLGWEERVARVAAVYRSLPADDRRDAVIVTENYGQAGALQLFGPREGLPEAVTPAGSFWHFGPGAKPGRVLLGMGIEPGALRSFYDSVAVVGRIDIPYTVAEERGVVLTVARGPRSTIQAIWPSLAGRY